MVRRGLKDVNANGPCMRNHACARVNYMYVRVDCAALRVCLVRPLGCGLSGAYAAAAGVITHELAVV